MPPTFSERARGASRILGTGRCIPEDVITNEDLEKIVDTTDEWITTRTGMKRRHRVAEDEATSDLAAVALRRAAVDAGIDLERLDAIIIGTATPDMPFPSTACFVQQHLDLPGIPVFDINAACSGFIYASTMANSLIAAGQFETVGVIGAETLTRITNYKDRSTCVLFGDAAGAAIFGPGDGERGVMAAYLGADGNLSHLLNMPGGGSREPASLETVESDRHYIHMEGSEVFKAAVRAMESSAEKAIKMAGITGKDVDLLIPHQANIRIIKATGKRVRVDDDRVYINVQEYGNTSAASIPIALDEAREQGLIGEGSVVVMVAFGGGFTWGSLVVRL
jgi:3-oxoacyl-[acyl-carrier-protein] synthase-3